jgi:hypothetical protein
MFSLIDDSRLELWVRQAILSPQESISLLPSVTLSLTKASEGHIILQLEAHRDEYGDDWINKVLQQRYLEPEQYNPCIPLVSHTGHWLLQTSLQPSLSGHLEADILLSVHRLITLAGLS